MTEREARDIARAAINISARTARQTRATWRGNIEDGNVQSDGSAHVTLPNGAVIKVSPSNLFTFSAGQSLTMFRNGGQYEAAGPSAYSGGLGAPYSP